MNTLSSGSKHAQTASATAEETQDLYSHRAALSSAVNLTMPQPTQNSLIHVLLLWTTILSIFQAVFIILFFTVGYHGPSLNSSAVAPEPTTQPQANKVPLLPSENRPLHLWKGEMVTYKATEVDGKIKWEARSPMNELISAEGKDLEIKKDGHYFINLQVKLKRCNACDPCNGTRGSECTVSLIWEKEVLLHGCINTCTCSTGLLGKVVALSGGSTLQFNITIPNNEIDETESLTHLDIIYMP